MSILLRVLPFWIFGILTAWASKYILRIDAIWIVLFWLLVLLSSWMFYYRSVIAIPKVSFPLLALVYLTSFQITAVNSGSGLIPDKQPTIVYGRIVKVWDGNNSDRLKVHAVQYHSGGIISKCDEFVLLLTGKNFNDTLSPGLIIKAETRLARIEKKTNPEDFPERLYWAGEGIRHKGWIKSFESLGSLKPSGLNPGFWAENLQKSLCDNLDGSSIGKEEAAIIKAMLLGNRDQLTTDIRDVFQQTGISHLLAVSGLHVGLIYIIVVSIFSFIKLLRRSFWVEILAVAAVWSYSLISGFGPSVQRAALMISIFALSRIMGRRVEPLQVLVVAFILQTAFDPFAIFRFGFQLSYLAVAGIFIVYRPWTRLVRFPVRLISKVWNYAGISISAQILTLPFVLVYFHEFPLYFILGNLLLVPIGLLVFYLGAAYLVVVSTGASFHLLDRCLELLIKLMVNIGEAIAGFPSAVIGFGSFKPFHMLAYYSLIVSLLLSKRYGLFERLRLALYTMLAFSILWLMIDLGNLF